MKIKSNVQVSTKNPLISVVIPAFNEERLIRNCLDQIKKQSFSNFELIVVDNNSTDATATIAKEYGAKVIFEKKRGNTFALNTGMLNADCEIIAVTDADTKPDENWLKEIAKIFSDQNVSAMTGSAQVDIKSPLLRSFCGAMYDVFIKINFMLQKPHLSGFNLAVRKRDFILTGGLNLNFKMSSDVDLGLRIKKYGKVVFVRQAIVKTSSRRWDDNFLKTFLEYFIGYLYAVWLRKPPPVRQTVIRQK